MTIEIHIVILKKCGQFHFNNTRFRWTMFPPLFSERNGHKKPFIRIGTLRIFKEKKPNGNE